MKLYIISTLIALSWMTSLIGIESSPQKGLRVRNTTDKNIQVTASTPDQKKIWGTATIKPHTGSIIPVSENLPQVHLTIGSIVPAHKQMTAIEPLNGSSGWLYNGKTPEGDETFVRLWKLNKEEIIPQGAHSSYALIKNTINRVDAFDEGLNKADTHQEILNPAIYATAIDAKSYVMVTQGEKRMMAKAYDPRVVRDAVIKKYKNRMQ